MREAGRDPRPAFALALLAPSYMQLASYLSHQ
jgi:hypothetical protein